MEVLHPIEQWTHAWSELHPTVSGLVAAFLILLLAVVAHWIARFVVVRLIRNVATRTAFTWDDALFQSGALDKLAWLAPALVLYSFAGALLIDPAVLRRFLAGFVAVLIALAIGDLLTAVNAIYSRYEFAKSRPIKGYLQIAKLAVTLIAVITAIAILFDRSPLVLLSGLGALTAVLLLIFRDTILSFVASIQIASNDMVRLGDWIEMPKYGADGDVIDIALHTIKIRNWDKTITTIPTHKLVEDSFKNWRGMTEIGGRRIKRSLLIDQNSVRFVDPPLLARLGKMHLLRDYVPAKLAEIDEWNRKNQIDPEVKANGRRMTNFGTFRAYLEIYLRTHPSIHQDLTLLVRQLQPTADGIPLEVYCFTNDTRWAVYEKIQADVFDHLLAVLPEFGLRVFQRPAGSDLTALPSADRREAALAE